MSDTENAGGELEWQTELPNKRDQYIPEIDAAPTVVDGTVYVVSLNEVLYALDAETGEVQWEEWLRTAPEDAGAPHVHDGSVFVIAGAELFCIDAETGEREWVWGGEVNPGGGTESDDGEKHDGPTKALCTSPIVSKNAVFIGSIDNNLYAVDRNTGEKLWDLQNQSDKGLTDVSAAGMASPTLVDDTLYVTTRGHLAAINALKAEVEWEFIPDSSHNVFSAPTVHDGTVYFGNREGTLFAVDAETGAEEWLCWEAEGKVNSNPTVYDGMVYFSTIGLMGGGPEEIAAYAVDAETGDLMWEFDDPDDAIFDLTIADDVAYFIGIAGNLDEEEATLYAFDAHSGDELWTSSPFDTPKVQTTPIVNDGTIYFGDDDGVVWAIDAGVDASSGGTRTMLQTLAHHEERSEKAEVSEEVGGLFNAATDKVEDVVKDVDARDVKRTVDDATRRGPVYTIKRWLRRFLR